MKKILFLALVLLSVAAVLSNLRYLSNLSDLSQKEAESSVSKTPILRVALVADSHNENDLLGKALRQAQGKGINFVIGLGDYTNLGTVRELEEARAKFDESKLEYFLTVGDRDGWESRNREEADNFKEIFGDATRVFDREGIRFVILDNSDIYSGISQEDWQLLEEGSLDTSVTPNLTFVFAHKTPFHPESKHIMGEDNPAVAVQAERLLEILEGQRNSEVFTSKESEPTFEVYTNPVDGFFSGDLHFFATYLSPSGSVKITTVGAVALERNFQGPRFSVLTVWDDYSWEVEDVEIRMDANTRFVM